MEKEFVPYRQALALKGIGFDEPCIARFIHKQFAMNVLAKWYKHNSNEITTGWISAPTFSQCFKWFREKYNLYHSINIYNDKWLCIIKSTVSNEEHISGYIIDAINNGHPTFNTYEETESACLDKLIELIESKSE